MLGLAPAGTTSLWDARTPPYVCRKRQAPLTEEEGQRKPPGVPQQLRAWIQIR